MTDFYIFRHGDTLESAKPPLYFLIRRLGKKHDTHDLKLLPEGIPALEKTGEYLKQIHTDADFCSPYPRCVESSEIVGRVAGKKYKPDDRIRELENKGEAFSDFRRRVDSFLKEIENKGYSAVSICTHGAVMAAIKHLETNGKFYGFQVFDYPPPGQMLIIKNGKSGKIDFNSETVSPKLR